MNIGLLSAEKISLGEGALYAVIGFVIVLVVLALLVGIFYLSGFIFQSKLFNKQKKESPAAQVQQQSVDYETDEQLVAAITAAITCILAEESQGEAPEFVIKRITRKK